jgi:ferritin-like metal-binding protein YciE
MAEAVTSAAGLFGVRLRHMLYIEATLADEVLPRLLREAHSTDLRFAFERHLAETQAHVEIVRDLLSELGVRAEPEQSPALDALVVEHDRLLERVGAGETVAADLVHAMAASAT